MFSSRLPRLAVSSPRIGCERKLRASFNCSAKVAEYRTHCSTPVSRFQIISNHAVSPRSLRPSRSQLRTKRRYSQHRFTTPQEPPSRFRATFQSARHDHPILFPIIFVGAVGMLGLCGYLLYDQSSKQLLEPEMDFFSPAVKKHLQTAIWYSEINPDPVIMVDAFTKALAQIEKEDLDPLHTLTLGITLRFAQALEKAGQARGAVSLLEQAQKDIRARLMDIDRGGLTATNFTTSPPSQSTLRPVKAEPLAHERKRLIGVLVGTHDKLSQLFASDHIQDMHRAQHYAHAAISVLFQSMPNPSNLRFGENQAGLQLIQVAHLFNQAGTIDLGFGDHETALEEFKLALHPLRQTSKGKASLPEEVQVLSHMSVAVTTPYRKALDKEETTFLETRNEMLQLPEPQRTRALSKLYPPWDEPRWAEVRKYGGKWALLAVDCFHRLTPDKKDEVTIHAVLGAAFYLVQEASRNEDQTGVLFFSKVMLDVFEDKTGPGWEGLREASMTEGAIDEMKGGKESLRADVQGVLEFIAEIAPENIGQINNAPVNN